MRARALCIKIYKAHQCALQLGILTLFIISGTNDALASTHWEQIQPESAGQAVLGKIVVKSRYIACQVNNKRLYLSSDSGLRWSDVTNNLPDVEITCFALVMSDDTVLREIAVGTAGYGMYFSNNDMSSWVSQGVTSGSVTAIIHQADSLVIACDDGVVAGPLSSRVFSTFGNALKGSSVSSLARGVNSYLAGMPNGQVFRKASDKQDWDRVQSITLKAPLSCLSQNGVTAIAVARDGKWLSSRDSGKSWTHESSYLYATDITNYGPDFVAACWYQGVLVRVDSKDFSSHYLGQDIPNGRRGLGKGVCVANKKVYVTSDDLIFSSSSEVLADIADEQLAVGGTKKEHCGYVVAAGEELRVPMLRESRLKEPFDTHIRVCNSLGSGIDLSTRTEFSNDASIECVLVSIPDTLSPGAYFTFIPSQDKCRCIQFLVVTK